MARGIALHNNKSDEEEEEEEMDADDNLLNDDEEDEGNMTSSSSSSSDAPVLDPNSSVVIEMPPTRSLAPGPSGTETASIRSATRAQSSRHHSTKDKAMASFRETYVPASLQVCIIYVSVCSACASYQLIYIGIISCSEAFPLFALPAVLTELDAM
jgi:hypothetical protein